MTKSRPLLDRLRKTSDLALVVPRLQPAVLHRVIQICGLEDCADVIAAATPSQISRILDVDIWRAPKPGLDEDFDADRFGEWIEVLLQAGDDVAIRTLVGLDPHLIIAGLAQHVAVFDSAAVSQYITLDGELSRGRRLEEGQSAEIGGYVVQARRPSSWDAIVEVLRLLDAEQPDCFHRLMQGCRRLSDGHRELDVSHDLLTDNEQEMFDLACARESRREREGYMSAPQARAFLQMARHVRLTDDTPPAPNAIAHAYFRALEPPPVPSDETPSEADATVAEILRDEGVLPAQPRALLGGSVDRTPSRLALIHAFVVAHAASGEELAYLANTLMSGCSLQRRSFTEREASDAAAAVCNLGLENWPRRWNEPDLIGAFQVGLAVLQQDVSMHVAERLTVVLGELRTGDRDIQIDVSRLRRELIAFSRDGEPWRARQALEVIMLLDAPSWAALASLLDEHPVMHGAIGAALGTSKAEAIDVHAFEFISENSQIASIRAFMQLLPVVLAGT
jgi:hypothetical protein